ncbi:iron ABC transporter substrate-binding protein [Arcanobacterium pinnipediorum]|uniref:Iron ABC transporter substrate-binding protein n=1 Tax=Arcanobacterium pinnipediorum TaxID=1503041 RepID=A0ABY5AHN2_9ACTO|nr:iron ABC transporter substrate-binding protein [Arcanobacterium pinnipediorum]USR79704.1 iron ABC transporter substrate-binding protein [Arcanobacterium pinnipediorum]
MLRIRPASVSALAAIFLTLSACSTPADNNAEPSQPESQAKVSEELKPTEEPLVIYSGRNEKLVAPLMEEFTKDTGVKVDIRYAGTPELAAQLLEEGEKTPAQVFLSQDAGALGLISGADMFAPLDKSVTEKVAPEYTSHDGSWVGLTGRARVMAYDSEKLTADEVPADVFELTDPKWNGKVGIAPTNASFQSFVTAMRVMEGEEKTEKWLTDLKANNVQTFAKNGEILEAVNNGAVEIGLINHYYWARSEQDPKTLRAQLKFGKPGSVTALVNVTGVGILKKAADNPNAQIFVDYMLSDKAQDYFLEKTFEYPLLKGAKSPANVPALNELGGPDVKLSELSSLNETIELLTKVGML